ncbi:TetR/AcrR family transcriptional regulator [Nonomuraea sp. MCN248]|uniref:TetR/AcrR family transcriptional regulator n=1 Tax=Nonomuraea corallina TaxID=2989783 RepID=A0ABT4S485_9ACTN|nr:TetR/AcrR family transcriptional regulator [Nonomuraea corallina]MDA0631835.1 TetR/AcrR family transcriptional regulator [Nonomuraea corallina]
MVTPRKSPRQQRSRETVEAILEAAAQLFQRHGYATTTTNKIADRAGVSVGSLYQYFPNKDALLLALADRHLNAAAREVMRVFERAAGQPPDLTRLVTDLVACVAALHEDRPQLHRLLFDQAPRTPELVALFRETERVLAAALAGELRRLGADDPDVTALLAVQGVEAQVHGALLDDPGRREAIVRLWVNALGRK